MKINILLKSHYGIRLSVLLSAFLLIGVIGCNDDHEDISYFGIEGTPANLQVASSGISYDYGSAKQFVIRSNRGWHLEQQDNSTWSRIFPMEGNDDGIIRVSVERNLTLDPRTVSYAFFVNGEEQP